MSEIEFRYMELTSSELVDSTVLDHITNLQEFESNGYIFHPPPPSPSPQPSCSTSTSKSDFPRRLPPLLENEEALKGQLLCYLPQSDDMPNQSIKKTFTEANQVEPAFVYVRYYARVAVKTKKKMFSKNRDSNKKELFVWPAVRETRNSSSRKYLQVQLKVGWLEALVQLDFSEVSKKEKKFEIGVRGFEKGDYLVIQKFGVTFGKENINTDKLFGKCPSIVGSVADTDSSNPNSDREDTNKKQCRGADTEERELLQKSESKQQPRENGFNLQDCLQALVDCLRRSIFRFLRRRCY